jgi:hypothetical protein
LAVTPVLLPPLGTLWVTVPVSEAPAVPSVTKLTVKVVVNVRSLPYEVPAPLVA